VARVLSALVLIPLVFGMIWFAPPFLLRAFALLIAFLALAELRKLIPNRLLLATLGALYLLAPLLLLVVIRNDYGPGVVMMLVGTLVASDTAQFYTGRAFGKHKLAPSISPKKTIEGAVGGLVVATVVAVFIGRVWLPGLEDWQLALAGLAMAIAGIAGDLFESWLKRRAGVKDSSDLIPGHGGVLDRIDSWLFATPVFFLFLRLTA
jgi:phosphatidate cytidylyltransferase